MNKPYAESCEQNREPIFNVLQPRLQHCDNLLEIGSGTGQHAVYFAAELPHLKWQTSDRRENHPGIQLWLDDALLSNTLSPLTLDVIDDPWPQQRYDAVFTANTLHIMDHAAVAEMFAGVEKVLRPGGCFLIYGPFNYNGQYTSGSNERFDQWLKERDANSGIKDLQWLTSIGFKHGLSLYEDVAMPANNRMLVWRREPVP